MFFQGCCCCALPYRYFRLHPEEETDLNEHRRAMMRVWSLCPPWYSSLRWQSSDYAGTSLLQLSTTGVSIHFHSISLPSFSHLFCLAAGSFTSTPLNTVLLIIRLTFIPFLIILPCSFQQSIVLHMSTTVTAWGNNQYFI